VDVNVEGQLSVKVTFSQSPETVSLKPLYLQFLGVYNSVMTINKESMVQTNYSENNVNINELHSTKELIIYPNPANTRIFFSDNAYTYQSYSIYNINGQIMMDGIINPYQPHIDISSISGGTYIISLIGTEGVYNGTFIKYK
jgi:hypothetical protein